jgi:predicted RNase H-like nuclease (RuvC/YqgF family)
LVFRLARPPEAFSTQAGANMSDEIKTLEEEISRFEKEQAGVAARIRELQAAEDPLKGVFRAAEIHAAKQEKLKIDFEIQYRRAKINRTRFGGE